MKLNIPLRLLEKLVDSDSTDSEVKSLILTKFRESNIKTYQDIKSFEDACMYLGLSETGLLGNNTDKNVIAYIKLKTVIEALNDGWKPDFTDHDHNQNKYYNYFEVKDGLFVFCDVNYNYRYMTVPAALYLKNSELAMYAKDNFLDLYKTYYE